ncbi:putative Ig domain-containing protein [Larkinella humicola]|uniref:Uncharacterized protein n=1 Tax=Larkinella humicola TaxID=2607654 RepID=A0A5N1JL73_9BACT|nr:putative Ig domain-containing protein [Larkinella humicola]KAA9356177.1 hypothetical protein F0P93_00005 [Larkinella humicola]
MTTFTLAKTEYRIRLFSLFLLLLTTGFGEMLQAQPIKVFDKTFGGADRDDGQVMLKTADGGYLVGGYSDSEATADSPKEAPLWGDRDYWLIKFDASHNKQWEKTYGGSEGDYLRTIVATPDGYLLGGESSSPNDGNKESESFGSDDFWVVKIDFAGEKQWDKSFGGDEADNLWSIVTTSDGKFLLAGYSNSGDNGTKTAEKKGDDDAFAPDFWVVKIDADGNQLWDQTYGGEYSDRLRKIVATADGNFLLAGTSSSDASPPEDLTGKTENGQGNSDYWVVKINADGVKQWDKTFGGDNSDDLYGLVTTADGGYVLAGYSNSNTSGDKSEDSEGRTDFWVLKIDPTNEIDWQRTVGGPDDDYCYALLATSDGGFLLGGTWEFYYTVETPTRYDYWVVKLNADGNTQWEKKLGGGSNSDDMIQALLEPTAGNYLLAGYSNSEIGVDKTAPNLGSRDLWLILLEDPCVPPTISITSNVSTQPVFQNTPGVALSITGCTTGTLSWNGPNGTTGTGTTISVPTSATGTLVYSATCTAGSCTSSPASTTITVAPPLITGSFDGFVYGADCATFRGWAWDRNKPNTAVSVDILDGPNVIASLSADVFRQDLQSAGKGNGRHAFFFTIPDNLKDGLPHNLSARVSGSSFILKDSPKALICQGTGSPANKAPVSPSPTILIAPLVAQVGVPFAGTLVAFTDPEAQPLTYALAGLPDGLAISMTSRVISGTPTQAGTFVLTYSASDGVLTNSVSFPLTVNPASTTTVTGSFEGYLDKLDCGGIRGWVWDRNKPNTPLTVEFYLEGSGTVLGSALANIYRQDLKDAGKGNGAHAYNFSPPGSVTNGTLIRARVLGSTYDLKGSPKAYQCAPARLSAETPSDLQVTVLGNPVAEQVAVEIRGAAGQPLRLQLTDASGRLVSQRHIEAAKPVEQQRFSVQGQPAGLLFLQVSSGLKTVSLKVLKQ